MNQTHSSLRNRGISMGLVAGLLISCIAPAATAKEIANNVKPSYDEAYYATVDYYGNLLDGSVVKSYTLNGVTTLTDKGSYDEIINLTDGSAPASQEGGPTFQFGEKDVPSHFYFEGKTSAPFETLPWTISVSYTLNGVPTPAEDLAGKTGVVEIIMDVVPNENASQYAKSNYTLEATAMFNQDDILSLEADGAQVQLIGNIRMVLFAVLPGETAHRVIRVGADEFSFDGLTFLLVPATLGQLEELSKLSQRKDDLENDYRKLSGSLDTLLGSFSALGGSLRETANGLDELNSARDTISAGKDKLYSDGDQVLEDLQNLNNSLNTLPGHLNNADNAVTDVTDSLDKVSNSAVRLQGNFRDLNDCIIKLQKDLDHLKNNSGDLDKNLDALGADLKGLQDALEKVRKNIADLDLTIHGGIVSDILDEIPDSIKGDVTLQGMTAAELEQALQGALPIQAAWTTVAKDAEKIGFRQFQLAVMLVNEPSLTLEKAEKALDIFEAVYQQNPDTTNRIKIHHIITQILVEHGMPLITAGIAAELYTSQYLSYREKLPPMQQVYGSVCGSLEAQMSRPQFFGAMLMLNALKALTPEEISAGGAQKILAEQASFVEKGAKICSILDAINQDYDTTHVIGLLAKLDTMLTHMGKDGLIGTSGKLVKNIGTALENLNSTADTGRDILKRLDTVLDRLDDLNSSMMDQVPGLRNTIRDTRTLVSDMVVSVDDTHSFLTSFRSLAQNSGEQLDAGTKKSLENLSLTLRRTANSTDAVGDVKVAKDAVNEIVEDTWHEYTGDINNILLMDPHADTQSLTSPENPSPTSVQILIRTQEIKVNEASDAQTQPVETDPLTFWGRVGQMFKDFWAKLTGIFH